MGKLFIIEAEHMNIIIYYYDAKSLKLKVLTD